MTALNPAPPGVMLAKQLAQPGRRKKPGWVELPDPTGYWMSEKMDGVRAYWDGVELVSRQGNVFAAPKWFTECFPKQPLDGELWMGRGTFNQTSGIVRREKPHKGWRYLVYFVFDAPTHGGPFEERRQYLERLIAKADCQYLRHVPSLEVQSKSHLDAAVAEIVRRGGEGVMIVRPGSHYTPSRTASILKVKKFADDEATVVEHVPGKGRHRGRMGALLVEDSEGRRFKVGTGFSDAERDAAAELYPPGTLITFQFFERTPTGKPREPRFMRVRAEEPGRASNMPAAIAEDLCRQGQPGGSIAHWKIPGCDQPQHPCPPRNANRLRRRLLR